MPTVHLFYIFLTSLLTSLVLIPNISRLAVSIGIFDGPDQRKCHTRSVPRLGGIAIFFAVVLGLILFTEVDRHIRGFLAGAVIVFLTGLTDDLEQISPYKKFLGQLLAALIVTLVGDLRLTSIGDLFGWGEIRLGYLSIPFTVFGIVGTTNAINLLDGLDGLAGGVTAVAAAAIGVLAYLVGHHALIGMSAALLGGVLGFLKFNRYPARIFMGDGGSLFLGYSLAVLSILLVEHTRAHGQGSVLTPLVILAVPVFDTIFVMGKRLLSRRALFMPDRSHIHHRYMELGLDHRSTVVLLYALCYFLAAYAVLFRHLPDRLQLVNLVLLLVFFCLSNSALAGMLTGHRDGFLGECQSFLNVAYRCLLRCFTCLLLLLKYLVPALLILPFFTSVDSFSFAISSVFILTGILLLLTPVGNGGGASSSRSASI